MNELARHPERLHVAFLRSGVTSVLDCGGYPWTRDMARATVDNALAPRVMAAGPLLATWVPPLLQLAEQACFIPMSDEDAVRAAVADHAAAGSDAIKVWLILAERSLEELTPLVQAAGEAARAHGLPLIVHATQLEAARVAVAAGARLLVHSVDDALVDQEFLDDCRAGGVFYCPTLTVLRGYRRMSSGDLPEELLASLDRISPWVAERVRVTSDAGQRPMSKDQRARRQAADDARMAIMSANLVAMAQAGIPVVLGTDAGNPLTLHGPSVVEELRAMRAAGLSADQVLRAATADAARAAGLPEAGRLQAGAMADLLVLDADPRLDVARLGHPRAVLRRGVLHQGRDLRAP
jgi:imidazolonepropionase-like amidohydrolase